MGLLSVSVKPDDEDQIIHLHCHVGYVSSTVIVLSDYVFPVCHTVCQIQLNYLYLAYANKI